MPNRTERASKHPAGALHLSETDVRVLELMSRGVTQDGIAAALGATSKSIRPRVLRVTDAVLELIQQEPSKPEASASVPPDGTEDLALEDDDAALLEAVRGDRDTLMAVLAEAARLLRGRKAAARGMTTDQTDFLIRSGSMTAEELAESESEVARGELEVLEYRTELKPTVHSLGVPGVAELLNVDESEVLHRELEGQLFAFRADTSLRFPLWQFVREGRSSWLTLPGLRALVAAIPGSMHPASVLGFMGTPQEDLLVGQDKATPRQWLIGGGEVQQVLDILTERDRS